MLGRCYTALSQKLKTKNQMKYEKKYGKRDNNMFNNLHAPARPIRRERTLKNAERTASSPLPREMSAKILGNPKNKLTAKNRKRVMRSRYFTVINPGIAIEKSMQDRITANVAGLSMTQLVRRTIQCPHRIQKAKSILEDLSPDSSFAPGIRYNIAVNVFILATVEAEIARRSKAPAVRDARTPRVRKWDAIKAALSQPQPQA